MHKNRVEAFSDGVVAIIITIMVLELKVPHGDDLEALSTLKTDFFSYVLSFIYVGIYWNNHHHLFQAVEKVRGATLWANLHLLFWLSLIPFSTAWMGENKFSQWPVLLYGFNLLFCSIAYYILTKSLVHNHDENSALVAAVGNDRKGMASTAIYILAIGLSFLHPWFAYALYIAVAIIWLVPDRRIERVLMNQAN
jgi:uncharacterized membrane protein